MATVATFRTPTIHNEPNKTYAQGSPDRQSLADALEALKKKGPLEVPVVIGGKHIVRPVERYAQILLYTYGMKAGSGCVTTSVISHIHVNGR